jgi:hypothetical protein
MTRKLGQIIAVRENTWMIRIPMGCDSQTKQRNYYNRTVHGSLRQRRNFLERRSRAPRSRWTYIHMFFRMQDDAVAKVEAALLA